MYSQISQLCNPRQSPKVRLLEKPVRQYKQKWAWARRENNATTSAPTVEAVTSLCRAVYIAPPPPKRNTVDLESNLSMADTTSENTGMKLVNPNQGRHEKTNAPQDCIGAGEGSRSRFSLKKKKKNPALTMPDGGCPTCGNETCYPDGFCPSFDMGPIKTAEDNIEYVSTEDGANFPNGHSSFRQKNPILRFRQFPEDSTEDGLRETFGMFGSVKRLSINKVTPADKCSGVVRFFYVEDAERAMNSFKDQFEVNWLF